MASIRDAGQCSDGVSSEPRIILIAGPTGVGKTALAVELAEAVGGEIVSADSRQVYRGMEIGTAQPSAAELRRVRHHLVGFLRPDEPFSVAQFVDAAEAAMADIAGRGRPVMIVGGSSHYVQALLDGLELPRVPPNLQLRARLERLAREQGAATLHERLDELDSAAAREIPAANVRRVIRALEVIEASGRPFSEVGRSRRGRRQSLRLGLTMLRSELYARVDDRVDAMLEAGWLEEIRRLRRAGYGPALPALSSTGYRELIQCLEGELPLDEAVRRVKYSTHAYIRRQYAWLRRDSTLDWVERGPAAFDEAIEGIRGYLEGVAQGTIRR